MDRSVGDFPMEKKKKSEKEERFGGTAIHDDLLGTKEKEVVSKRERSGVQEKFSRARVRRGSVVMVVFCEGGRKGSRQYSIQRENVWLGGERGKTHGGRIREHKYGRPLLKGKKEEAEKTQTNVYFLTGGGGLEGGGGKGLGSVDGSKRTY